MKSYPQVINRLFYEPLVITRARHQAICQVMEAHLANVGRQEAGVNGKPDPEFTADDDYVEAGGGAVIIPVHGVLVARAADIPASSCGCGLDEVEDMIDVAMQDDSIGTLLFDFNTPGGAVTGIPELGRKIAGISSKRTIGWTETECCSGGMWLAEQCQQFYSTESATLGSIGVWCAYMDATKALKKDGVKVQEFFAGKYKTMGASWKSLSDEEGAMIQARVDKIYGQFKAAVQNHRVVEDAAMQGQTFDGPEAAAAGLTDGCVDSVEDLL